MTQTVKQGVKVSKGTAVVGAAGIMKMKAPKDGPLDRSTCTHFCKWDEEATGGRWFECNILGELGSSNKV